jgi:hypothetical protein
MILLLHAFYLVKDERLRALLSPRSNIPRRSSRNAGGPNTEEVIDAIMKADGSVQGLAILSADKKEVFQTFKETSQLAIITQAALRAK